MAGRAAPAAAAKKAAKKPAKQAVSPATGGPSAGATEAVSGAGRVRAVRKGRVPGAGERLRRELGREQDTFAVSVLIEQAARNADRLDVINDLLSGDSKAWFEVEIAGQVAEVRVTNLVVEERQRSAALQRSIVDIQRMRGDRPGPAQSDGKARRGVSPIDRIQQGRK